MVSLALSIGLKESTNIASFLATLPQDCWNVILSHLARHDIALICATSQGLRASSEHLLYRHVSLDWTNPPFDQVLTLLQATHGRPELAAHIRHVSMLPSRLVDPSPHGLEPWAPPEIQRTVSQSSKSFHNGLDAARDIVSRAQFSSPEEWTAALESGDVYAFVAIFLSQLHNLQTLRLDYTFVWQFGWPGRMLKHSLLATTDHGLSQFSDLTHVEYGLNAPPPPTFDDELYDYMEGFPPCHPEQFEAWFYLPSLESLEIWLQNLHEVLDVQHGTGQLCTWPSNLPRLKHLVLTQTSITEEQVAHLLCQTESLESFHLGLVYHCFQKPRREPLVQGSALLEGLMSIRHTVEHLSIGLEFYPRRIGEVWNDSNPQPLLDPFRGILKRFPRLRSAEIPIPMLFGWNKDQTPNMTELLPDSLETLCLRQDLLAVERYQWMAPFTTSVVQGFLPSLQAATPGLTQLTLRLFRNYDTLLCGREVESINLLSLHLGMHVSFRLIHDGLSPGLWTAQRDLTEWVPCYLQR